MRGVRKERLVSHDAYFAMQEETDELLEYVGGYVYAMTGGRVRHYAIIAKLMMAFGTAAEKAGCQPLAPGVKVRVDAADAFYAPDMVIVCGARDDPGARAVGNPTVVIEVLSPTTESSDRREKLRHYRMVPSIREIVLVWQDERRVEVHRRTGEDWEVETIIADGTLPLVSIDAAMDLAEVYGG